MNATHPLTPATEDLLADLTDAAYRVALRHGFYASFVDVELDLWAELRRVLGEAATGRRAASRKPRREIQPCQA